MNYPPLPIIVSNKNLKERWEKWKHFSKNRKERFINNHIASMRYAAKIINKYQNLWI